jgi:hypothetical protein
VKYRHTPSPRQVVESNDAVALVLLAESLDRSLDTLKHATARRAVMRARALLLTTAAELNP